MPVYSNFDTATLTEQGMLEVMPKLIYNKAVVNGVAATPLLFMLGGLGYERPETPIDNPFIRRFSEVNFSEGSTETLRYWIAEMYGDKDTEAAKVVSPGSTYAQQSAATLTKVRSSTIKAESYRSSHYIAMELTDEELKASKGMIGTPQLAKSIFVRTAEKAANAWQQKHHKMTCARVTASRTAQMGFMFPFQNAAVVHGIDQATVTNWQANVVSAGNAVPNLQAIDNLILDHTLAGRKKPTHAICSKAAIYSRVRNLLTTNHIVSLGPIGPDHLHPKFPTFQIDGIFYAADGQIAVENSGVASVASSIAYAHLEDWYFYASMPDDLSPNGDSAFGMKRNGLLYEKAWRMDAELLCLNPWNQLLWSTVGS